MGRVAENVFDFGDGFGRRGGGGGGGAHAPVFDRIIDALQHRFATDLATNRPHLVGLLFGKPHVDLVKNQIIPELKYWHHRSDRYIDLFCVGFSAVGAFDAAQFTATLNAFESKTHWSYSGGTDLILVNAVLDQTTKRVSFDFHEVLSVTLEQVVKVNGFESPSMFFEKVFAAAKRSCGVESPVVICDAIGGSLLKSAFKGALSSLVPDDMKQEARDAFLFTVKDISKKK